MAKKGNRQAQSKKDRADAAAKKKKPDAPSKSEASAGLQESAGGHHGLVNLGNTCFLNSILQCLSVSSPFSDRLMELSSENLGGIGTTLSAVFKGILGFEGGTAKDARGNKAITPKPLLSHVSSKCPWFKSGQQQDAHELLRTLLGILSEEYTMAERKAAKLSDAPKAPGTPTGSCERLIWDSFRGWLYSMVLCWSCQRVSTRLDPFLDLSLEVPQEGAGIGPMGVPSWIASVSSSSRASVSGKLSEAPSREKDAVDGPEREESVKDDSEDEDSLDEFEILLKRDGLSEPWGFEWSTDDVDKGRFVLESVIEESCVDRWNLKRRTMGRPSEIISRGVTVVRVEKKSDFEGMKNALLESGLRLGIRFSRSGGKQDSSPPTNKKAAKCKTGTPSEGPAKKLSADELRAFYVNQANELLPKLPRALQDAFGSTGTKAKAGSHCHLTDCLQRFTSAEALEDEFQPIYQCSECAKKRDDAANLINGAKSVRSFASRRYWLWPKLPPLLTLQLKKFQRRGSKFEKLNVDVDLPPTLDFRDYILTRAQHEELSNHFASDANRVLPPSGDSGFETRYELYGLCVHLGSSLQSGHYIAYVNTGPSLEKERWYSVSDSHVSKCTRSDVLTAEAYIAFYRSVGVELRGRAETANSEGRAGSDEEGSGHVGDDGE